MASDRSRLALPLLLGVAFLVRFKVATEIGGHPLLQPVGDLDAGQYFQLSSRVMSGDLGLGPGLYFVSPLYVYFLALVRTLVAEVEGIRLVQCAMGTLTVALIYFMALEWFGRRAALIAGAMAAVCGVLVFYELLLMQAAIDPLLTSCGLAALTLALKRGGSRWLIVAGLVFGAQILNRPNIAVAVASITLMLLVVRPRLRAVVFCIGVVVGLLPVLVRNVVVANQWTVTSSHGGLNFFIGNSPLATGLYQAPDGIRPDIEGQRVDARRVAESAAGRGLSDAEVSNYFVDQAINWMRDAPFAALVLFGKKLVLATHADHVPLPESYEFFAFDVGSSLRWLIVNPWLVFPLGLMGVVLTARHNRPFAIWAVFVPAYAVSIALFFVAERYRLPLLPPLLVAAGGFLDRMITALQSRSQRRSLANGSPAAVIGGLCCAFAVVNWPLNLADGREGDRLRMVLLEARAGRSDQAEAWATRALASSKSPGYVHQVAGRGFVEAKQWSLALPHLRAASGPRVDVDLVAVDMAEALGGAGDTNAAVQVLRQTAERIRAVDLQLRAGRLAGGLGELGLAESIFRSTVTRSPGLAEAWSQLGLTQLVLQRFSDAQASLATAVRLDGRDAIAMGGLAFAELQLGRRDDARRSALAALRIDPNESLARQVISVVGGN